jgi:hypothetical protein
VNGAPHRQVPVPGRGFRCDEEIVPLIAALNNLGVATLNSCQYNNRGRGTARRVWVQIPAADLSYLFDLLDRPAETADVESLSARIAPYYEPDDWKEYRADRCWHYDLHPGRGDDGQLLPVTVSVRFPYTDLAEVTARLAAAAATSRPHRPATAEPQHPDGWSDADLALLAGAPAQGLSMADVAARVGRSYSAVRSQAHRNKIRFPSRSGGAPWTAADDAILAELAPTTPYRDIAAQLGRSRQAVAIHAHHLGIKGRPASMFNQKPGPGRG